MLATNPMMVELASSRSSSSGWIRRSTQETRIRSFDYSFASVMKNETYVIFMSNVRCLCVDQSRRSTPFQLNVTWFDIKLDCSIFQQCILNSTHSHIVIDTRLSFLFVKWIAQVLSQEYLSQKDL